MNGKTHHKYKMEELKMKTSRKKAELAPQKEG
jgi:hypothetical protein